ncbi:hypothetical protein DMB65_18095 [Flavobacterium cheongpyeongense]|uniref:Uncharacterized protein n=1 Tax=Flavobacterium cheongpyeongense TaxID=2212651 RepID=A0A2V4BK74_9FLAO|nr:hypothetical protein [Flavobacterium cheongpyeongense]PXY39396.1 hypothetical protein DMB65_18095 [Flavobacterium cheongpyeongense]
MEEKPKRKRISTKQSNEATIVNDVEGYQENCCSPNAKKIGIHSENIIVNFWIDKHYSNRDQYGEDDGAKREDIGIEYVEKLVQKALPHLIYYSLKHKSFQFVNHPPPKSRGLRVVLKEEFDTDITLNIIAEYHFFDTNTYEVTVITAMRKEDFKISVGQFELIFNSSFSTLNQKNGNNIQYIDTFEI